MFINKKLSHKTRVLISQIIFNFYIFNFAKCFPKTGTVKGFSFKAKTIPQTQKIAPKK